MGERLGEGLATVAELATWAIAQRGLMIDRVGQGRKTRKNSQPSAWGTRSLAARKSRKPAAGNVVVLMPRSPSAAEVDFRRCRARVDPRGDRVKGLVMAPTPAWEDGIARAILLLRWG
jgi:hypothetical protein